MKYTSMVEGRFIARPNRFIAQVEIGGREETVHVKNTGRCRELLPPGARVWCQVSHDPRRKTKYDLITVQKGDLLINMDSQAPNHAAREWLEAGGLGPVEDLRAEVKMGDSRFDFAFRKDGVPCFLEVKGVTLEQEGVCAFPDAPTERGARHLRELTALKQQGYGAYVLFVIQMSPVKYLRPHDERDPAFGKALREAAAGGVEVLAVDCRIGRASMTIKDRVAVCLDL